MLSSCGGEKIHAVRTRPAGESGELKRCLQLASKKKHNEAVECLEVFKSRYQQSEAAADADLLIADGYFRQHEYLLAAEAYKDFVEKYPYHQKIDYAYYQAGLSYLLDTPRNIDRDQKSGDAAIKSFELVMHYFPDSTYGKLASRQYQRARSKMAHKHFYVARFYYKYGEYLASIPRFAEIINSYPQLGYDNMSFYYLITALVKTKQMDKAKEALQLYETRYPGSHLLKKAKEKVKET